MFCLLPIHSFVSSSSSSSSSSSFLLEGMTVAEGASCCCCCFCCCCYCCSCCCFCSQCDAYQDVYSNNLAVVGFWLFALNVCLHFDHMNDSWSCDKTCLITTEYNLYYLKTNGTEKQIEDNIYVIGLYFLRASEISFTV